MSAGGLTITPTDGAELFWSGDHVGIGKRSIEHCEARWTYDLRKVMGSGWIRAAQDRMNWRAEGEACVSCVGWCRQI